MARPSARRTLSPRVANRGLTVNSENVGNAGVLVLGTSTGYALLLVARYREELRRNATSTWL